MKENKDLRLAKDCVYSAEIVSSYTPILASLYVYSNQLYALKVVSEDEKKSYDYILNTQYSYVLRKHLDVMNKYHDLIDDILDLGGINKKGHDVDFDAFREDILNFNDECMAFEESIYKVIDELTLKKMFVLNKEIMRVLEREFEDFHQRLRSVNLYLIDIVADIEDAEEYEEDGDDY